MMECYPFFGRQPERKRHGSILSTCLKKEWAMLATIAIIILVLWLLGAFVVPVGGALIHILLVVGIIVLILHFVRGRGTTI